MPSSPEPRLSAEAQDDIREIQHYTLRMWGPNQEAEYAAAFDTAFARLATFPYLGRAREDVCLGCRGLRVRHHIAYYRVEAGEVVIARVLHEKMDPRGRV